MFVIGDFFTFSRPSARQTNYTGGQSARAGFNVRLD
jgi:UDP-glucose 4-epimerase